MILNCDIITQSLNTRENDMNSIKKVISNVESSKLLIYLRKPNSHVWVSL